MTGDLRFIEGKCPDHPHCFVAGMGYEGISGTIVHVSEILLSTMDSDDAMQFWAQVWNSILRKEAPGFFEEEEEDA